ncbi:hypothetical protein [Catenulispora subtropica]|uniref:PknH-like extracellular domain-containing protein n=1 Tax=Catenulispora subtropica TaxID=450798 RepID=A0ABP5BY17_9ACTN
MARKARGAAVLAVVVVAVTATGCDGSGGTKKNVPQPVAESTLNGWTHTKLDAALIDTGDVPGYKTRSAPPARTPTTSRQVSDQCRDFTDASLQIASALGSTPVADEAVTGTGAEKEYGATIFLRAYATPSDAARALSAYHDGMTKCGRGVVALPDPALGDASAGYVAGSMEPGGFGGMAVQVGTLTVGVQLTRQGTSKADADALKEQLKAITQKQVEKVQSAQR